MLLSFWSVKGGDGTTVVAAALALHLARRSPAGVVLVDLAGDLPATLGADLPRDAPGVADWLVAGDDAPVDSLSRLERPVAPGLSLLARGARAATTGATSHGPPRADALAALLAADPRPVVADCGLLTPFADDPTPPSGPALAVAAQGTESLLVLRARAVSLRRAVAAPLRPSGVVLVVDEGRTVSRRDVEACLGVPVRARVRVTPRVARAVDSGLLASSLPRSLGRDLAHAA